MRTTLVLGLFCISLGLGACGTKPGSVEKGERRTYPHADATVIPSGGATKSLPNEP